MGNLLISQPLYQSNSHF